MTAPGCSVGSSIVEWVYAFGTACLLCRMCECNRLSIEKCNCLHSSCTAAPKDYSLMSSRSVEMVCRNEPRFSPAHSHAVLRTIRMHTHSTQLPCLAASAILWSAGLGNDTSNTQARHHLKHGATQLSTAQRFPACENAQPMLSSRLQC